jgi:hypothetical protein
MTQKILMPVLALVCWTLVMWAWMYLTRIPAIQRAGLDAAKMTEKNALDVLPLSVRQVADNYNHLHEQPVIFYALVFVIALEGTATAVDVALAWAYVGLRVAHSLFQALINFVPVRFVLFTLATIPLIVLAARAVLASL